MSWAQNDDVIPPLSFILHINEEWIFESQYANLGMRDSEWKVTE